MARKETVTKMNHLARWRKKSSFPKFKVKDYFSTEGLNNDENDY